MAAGRYDPDSPKPEWAGPSRSAQRREALDVLALARQLAGLTETQLDRLPLDEELREQIDEARRITQHIAHKRQLQFLAKHMRERDLSALREALSLETEARRRGSAVHKRLEHWRDRLLAEGDAALAEFVDQHPDADRQGLRQALAKARKPGPETQQLAAARLLFRKLREAHVAAQTAAGMVADAAGAADEDDAAE